MADPDAVLADLRAESESLDELVASLPAPEWQRPTPAEGWTIAHQIGHLAWTDDIAATAATDPDAFGALLTQAAGAGPDFVDVAAADRGAGDPAAVLQSWRTGREHLRRALAEVPAGTKLPWFGPPMRATSMATARLMETWAHGQDVADALGAERPKTDRVRNVAHIGVRTRDFSYAIRELAPPTEPFRIELAAPSGGTWTWGPADAQQRVTGSALDFCLLVTQRRHRDELALTATGPDADTWLGIAQAFAGAPGPGRPKP